MRALHVRLTLATALLLTVLTAALLALLSQTSEQYAAELRQRLDAGIAMYVVRELPLIQGGRVNETALSELARRAMTVNPSAEVYLLDAQGRVLSAGAPPQPLLRPTVNLAPIRAFLQSPEPRPLFGDDPASRTRQRVFSVEPIKKGGVVEGYLYVVLGGRPERSIAERLWGSYALRAGALTVLFIVALTIAAAAGLFFGLTRRLRALDASMDRWVRQMPPGAMQLEPAEGGGDELSALAARFRNMSHAIESHLRELKSSDEMRRELIANVSHDLRTPLASLRGYIETTLCKVSPVQFPDLASHLGVALRQAEQLGRLIEALFELARLESGGVSVKLEPILIAELLQDIAMRFRFLAESAGVRLTTRIGRSGIWADADIALIERVLSNLIENAIRHTPRDGEVCLEMRAEGSSVIIGVADTGCGIDAEQLPRIFERFQHPRRAMDPAHTGLGLPIVKRILDLHSQQVQVHSQKSRGTRVEFTLRRLQAPPGAAAVASA